MVVIRNSKKARRGGFCCYQIQIEAFLETIEPHTTLALALVGPMATWE
jgi:hypothetical protein